MIVETGDLKTIESAKYDEQTDVVRLVIVCSLLDLPDDTRDLTRLYTDLVDVYDRTCATIGEARRNRIIQEVEL